MAALVVLPNAWERQDRSPAGEVTGGVALQPTLVQPQVPGTSITGSASQGTHSPGTGNARPAGEPSPNAPTGRLGVSVGSVGGLYPGHQVKLGVRYMNPYSFPIAIDTVHLTATGTRRCTAAQLRPTRAPRLRIPSRSWMASSIEVGLRRTAPDACQGVRFAVRVRVTAVKL